MMYASMMPVELRSHEEYLNILNHLQPLTRYIELVQIDNDATDPIIVYALRHLTLKRKYKTNKWLGTVRGGAGVTKYTFEVNKSYWCYLQRFSSFFFTTTTPEGFDGVERSEFGLTDIAFLDADSNALFFTTTHEGYACLRKGLMA